MGARAYLTGSLTVADCRDCRGVEWQPEQAVCDADAGSVGAAWMGNGLGLLYSRAGRVYWRHIPNLADAAQSGETDTGLTGRVGGLAVNAAGALCALVDGTACVSRNRGASWEATVAPDPGRPEARLIAIGEWFLFVTVGQRVSHRLSRDGGATWE